MKATPDQDTSTEDGSPTVVPETESASTSSPKTFQELGVIDSLCEACNTLGYTMPTPIQANCIPVALQGRDLIGLAETGSGKTAAFVLPILQEFIDKPQQFQALIMAPTRELAQQISRTVEDLGANSSVRCTLLIGGMDMIPQAIALGKRPHVIVATPGRLLDHLENTKGFSLKNLKYLVLDEADRLLDLDFGPIIDKLLKLVPPRKTYLFSATMSSKVESLQRASLTNPVRVAVSSKNQTASKLQQSYSFIPLKFKDLYLVHLLHARTGQLGIIFTRTVHETQRLAIFLRHLDFPAIPIHGQLTQSARLASLNKFRTRSRNLLIATDVAARGLDIPAVDFVLNYDLPSDSKTYIHRVGRTARAGKGGTAISFVTQYEVEVWLRIEEALGKKVKERKAPKDEVMVFAGRVSEAQRIAATAMRDAQEKDGKGRRTKKRNRDDMDQDDG
ncbi:ATP-dependent rRNA helicase rrp3 [Aspergillus varians]